MNRRPILVPSSNLSIAWAQAFCLVWSAPRGELPAPLVISIDEFDDAGDPIEQTAVRNLLDRTIRTINRSSQKRRVQEVADTARTIFPRGSWSPDHPRPAAELFDRYLNRVLPRLRRLSTLNSRGTYFSRMIDATGLHGPSGTPRRVNQLEEILRWWRRDRGSTRRSALQVGIYDPAKDHNGSARSVFPCLQQISFTYSDLGLAVGAYYPAEYIFDRGYGNYLGLCHLGGFMAREMRLRLHRVNVFVSLPELGGVTKTSVSALANHLGSISEVSHHELLELQSTPA